MEFGEDREALLGEIGWGWKGISSEAYLKNGDIDRENRGKAISGRPSKG